MPTYLTRKDVRSHLYTPSTRRAALLRGRAAACLIRHTADSTAATSLCTAVVRLTVTVAPAAGTADQSYFTRLARELSSTRLLTVRR